MRFAKGFVAVLGVCALALSGCARDVTRPQGRVASPRAAAVATAGDYLVLFEGNGIPADLGARVAALGGKVTLSHAGAGFATISGLDAAGAVTLAAGAGVKEIEPDAVVTLDLPVAPTAVPGEVGPASPDDPAGAGSYWRQWNMAAIHADQAWAEGKLGSDAVTVAILDTGIDYDSNDLNGLVDLARSASFVSGDDQITAAYFPTRNPISDYHGHGTNVANQVSSNAIMLAGVTSHTRLIGVKVLGANGSGSFGGILSGLLWAADHGADVANMSIGGGFFKAGNGQFLGYLNRVLNYVASRGMLVVVAAGNESADLDHDGNYFKTFCNSPQVVCVSSVGLMNYGGSPDEFSYFSNYGLSGISVAGPGGNYGPAPTGFPWGGNYSWIYGDCSKTWITNISGGVPVTPCASGNYVLGMIGTSQATPHVAGLAALIIAETGRDQPAQVKAAILNSADDLGQPGTDPFYGRGRINVARALGL